MPQPWSISYLVMDQKPFIGEFSRREGQRMFIRAIERARRARPGSQARRERRARHRSPARPGGKRQERLPLAARKLSLGSELKSARSRWMRPTKSSAMRPIAARALMVTARVQRQVAGPFVAEDRGAPEPRTLFLIAAASGGCASVPGPYSLVEREEEFDLLRRRWERAVRGEGQLALASSDETPPIRCCARSMESTPR